MIRLTTLGCAAMMFCAASSAWAGEKTGFYLGGSTGVADNSVSFSQPGTGDLSYSDDDAAYKVFLGYNFGVIPLLSLAVEASYVDFGTAKATVAGKSLETKVDGVDAFGLLAVNLGPAALFAKAGAIDWNTTTTAQAIAAKTSGTDPAYGVGVQLQFQSLGIRAEYEVFDLKTVDISFASLGLSYTF